MLTKHHPHSLLIALLMYAGICMPVLSVDERNRMEPQIYQKFERSGLPIRKENYLYMEESIMGASFML